MRSHALAVAVLLAGASACRMGERPGSFVLPGPTVPSPLPISEPYVWDTREALAIWLDNGVTRGALELVGEGPEAFIRLNRADLEWTLRGPDLAPAATEIRTLRIRYRWRPDPSLSQTAVRTVHATAFFQTPTPIVSYDPHAQGVVFATLQPADEWELASFAAGQFTRPIEVHYCYLHSSGDNRGVLSIDRIELLR